jgi:hypothetical protein
MPQEWDFFITAKGRSKMKIFQTDPTEQFTQVPNQIFDDLMPLLNPAAFKIVCLIYRKTRGWHKDIDQISFSQILEGTGIKSTATVAKHIDSLHKGGIILRTRGGTTWDANSYALNPKFDTSTLKNEVEPTLKNEVEPTLKNEDTKDIPETQKTQSPNGGNGLQKNGQTQPAKQIKPQLTDQQKNDLLVFGKHPDTEANAQFDTIQEIANAGWSIREPIILQAVAHYIEAVRAKHPNFGIPNNISIRKDWYKAVKGHLEDYRIDNLAWLYQQAIERHAEKRLKYSRPGSLTNTLTDVGLDSPDANGVVAWL